MHVFPYSPRPGTVTAAGTIAFRPRSRRSGARGCGRSRTSSASRRWQTKLGAVDVVLVDRPGRGYGDDYSPWLVDAPVGELVRVRGARVTEEGILAEAA